ncbi:hypothetical protein, partial [Paracoccus halophilus]|uniref:hypothetical protein n=1 Tax=Paracoccus halophilus TaxID=376733 RepID=UPI001E42725D
LKNPMSITPYLPDRIRQGNVFTWVNSQWKFGRLPGQFSAEINNSAISTLIEQNNLPCFDNIDVTSVMTKMREYKLKELQ